MEQEGRHGGWSPRSRLGSHRAWRPVRRPPEGPPTRQSGKPRPRRRSRSACRDPRPRSAPPALRREPAPYCDRNWIEAPVAATSAASTAQSRVYLTAPFLEPLLLVAPFLAVPFLAFPPFLSPPFVRAATAAHLLWLCRHVIFPARPYLAPEPTLPFSAEQSFSPASRATACRHHATSRPDQDSNEGGMPAAAAVRSSGSARPEARGPRDSPLTGVGQSPAGFPCPRRTQDAI